MSREIELTQIDVSHFRRLRQAEVQLKRLNVVVGSNNAGKSSLLQAIHFGVSAASANRLTGRETFTQNTLLYCPSEDFTDLRHGLPYLNQSQFGGVKFHARNLASGASTDYTVTIYRGRNEGNVGCRRSGDPRLGSMITDQSKPFTIYVPGLAGVPRQEEYRSEGVIRRGVAGGDANLYLRNVLLLIQQKGKLPALLKKMKTVFPGFMIYISFNQITDVNVNVNVATQADNWRKCPIDLCGTGVLQALQIFSYITLFEPTVLLLDEPDAHLHPSNQMMLARALISAANDFETQIICSTHSRHLVDALKDEAQFIWLRNGAIEQQGTHLPLLPLLMDLGAIDGFDRLRAGEIDWFVLSEDSDMSMLKMLMVHAGFNVLRCEFRSYATSSRMEAALELACYIKEVSPRTHVIIHRDRDFMTPAEVTVIESKIRTATAIPFVTRPSDVEGYLVEPAHVAAVLGCEEGAALQWVDQIAAQNQVALQHSFTRKRDEIRTIIYRGNFANAPDTLNLLGNQIPIAAENRLGKEMLKKLRGALQEQRINVDIVQPSAGINVADLVAIRTAHQPIPAGVGVWRAPRPVNT